LSRPRILIGLLLAASALALLLHALPLLLWHLRFEQQLAALGHPERLHTERWGDLPRAPVGWTGLRVDNLILHIPLAENQRQRCRECATRCLLRLEESGTLAVFNAPPDREYGDALDHLAPDAGDLSLLRSVARNWQTIDALTDRARGRNEPPKSFRFETVAAKGIVTAFRVEETDRYVVHPYAPSGEPARVFGVAGVDRPTFERVLGGARVVAAAADGSGEGTSECGASVVPDGAGGPRETAVLLHGLGRGASSMSVLEAALVERGYRVINLDYPSTLHSIDELVGILAGELDRCCRTAEAPVHIVTHSLGGIMVRAYLAREDFAPLGRVVMLSPPNQGSELVDAFGDNPLYELILGPAAQELGTEDDNVLRELPAVDFELGVITGDEVINPIGAWLIPGESDGTVSVEGARVAGMKDFLVVHENHTFIMQSPEVVEQVVYFLEHGRFHAPPQ